MKPPKNVLAAPYHTIPYHAMPCHTMSYCAILHHTISNHSIPVFCGAPYPQCMGRFSIMFWVSLSICVGLQSNIGHATVSLEYPLALCSRMFFMSVTALLVSIASLYHFSLISHFSVRVFLSPLSDLISPFSELLCISSPLVPLSSFSLRPFPSLLLYPLPSPLTPSSSCIFSPFAFLRFIPFMCSPSSFLYPSSSFPLNPVFFLLYLFAFRFLRSFFLSTGGVVYRGEKYKDILEGKYLFQDFQTTWVYGLQ